MAAVLGLVWMAFDIAYNGIAIHVIPELSQSAADPSLYAACGVLAASLGALQLTGHLVGGLWLASTSRIGMTDGRLSRALGWFGMATGTVFAPSFLGPNVLYPSYILLPAWLGWYGLAALRSQEDHLVPARPSTVAS